MIGHVRLIGNHLNCDMYELVFLAFKYLTILRPKAQISDLDHFMCLGCPSSLIMYNMKILIHTYHKVYICDAN